jgi:hypothetical protein
MGKMVVTKLRLAPAFGGFGRAKQMWKKRKGNWREGRRMSRGGMDVDGYQSGWKRGGRRTTEVYFSGPLLLLHLLFCKII